MRKYTYAVVLIMIVFVVAIHQQGARNTASMSRMSNEVESIHDEIRYGTRQYRLVVEEVGTFDHKEQCVPLDRTKKKLAWLNAPMWMHALPYTNFSGCSCSHCEISFDRKSLEGADLIIVHADFMAESETPGNDPNQIYVFYTAETEFRWLSPNTYRRHDWNSRFNWTLTYRLDSDILSTYSRLIYDDSKTEFTNYTEIVLNKTKSVVWFVSNCYTQSKRDVYVNELRKYIDVDIYGDCGEKTCHGLECDTIIGQYKFYLSFENAFCKDYVTEKFFKTFQYHTIPVVRGGADYSGLFPSGIYINTKDFTNPEHLADTLNSMDVASLTHIIRKMGKYKNGGNFLRGMPFICDLCEKLHQPNLPRKQYANIHRWWTEGVCSEPSDLNFNSYK